MTISLTSLGDVLVAALGAKTGYGFDPHGEEDARIESDGPVGPFPSANACTTSATVDCFHR